MNTIENGIKIADSQINTHQGNRVRDSNPSISSSVPTQQAQEMKSIEEFQKNQDKEDKRQQLNELAQQLNKELNPLNTSISFGFNEDINGMYVSVTETSTNRLIRKIPSDEAMELMAKMKEIVGIIFNKEA
ncbi:FlaG family protein [Helicobacter mesocricetorum]|uniref:FlaG family protein n=1 Tax=Helicobacter mesocricetorum TaxID=87012 RepID=UPI000CF05A3E|nr:FlaG family protein [Helicobacter mesocricetorum]